MATSKSAKIQAEMEKVKAKISEAQAKLKELEQKHREAENEEIVEIVRGMSVSAHNFRKKRAFFVKGATVATKCINKSRTILKWSSGSSLLVLA